MELFESKLNDSNDIEPGVLLLSEPFLNDYNFERAAILVCDYDEKEGLFGLVLNKITSLSVEEKGNNILSQSNLFLGGPVEQNTLHFIHTIDNLDGAVSLKDGVFWGGDYEQLKELFNVGLVNDSNCRLFLGYSGWAGGQIQKELEQNSWIINRKPINDLFSISSEDLWKEKLKTMGGQYKVYSNYPTDPRSN